MPSEGDSEVTTTGEDVASVKTREDVTCTKPLKDVVNLRRHSDRTAANSDVKVVCKLSPGAKNAGNDSGATDNNSVNESNKDKTTERKGKLSQSSSTSSLKSPGRTNNEDLNSQVKGKSKKRKPEDNDGNGKTENSDVASLVGKISLDCTNYRILGPAAASKPAQYHY